MKKELPFLFSSAHLASHCEVGENIAYKMDPLPWYSPSCREVCCCTTEKANKRSSVFQPFINHNLNNGKAILYLKDL